MAELDVVCVASPRMHRHRWMAVTVTVKRTTRLVTMLALSLGLAGCGNSQPQPTPGGSDGWASHPIEVRGSHLFNAVTGEPFFATGIAFPNLQDASIDKWIATLRRIKSEGPAINLIRLYEYPSCIWDTQEGYCFLPFMQEADKLGVYVLAAGTGTATGYLPITGATSANDAYQQGHVLDFGRAIVQRFYYPNTLAVVIGNEFLRSTTWAYASVLKAYARDLKAYMSMCNEDSSSPSFKTMRQIPLMYASNDDHGDSLAPQKARYLFCGDQAMAIDIFGLNVERWCDPNKDTSYDSIEAWVTENKFPGAFMFSEMGCQENSGYSGARDWAQIPGFFEKFKGFDGFSSYAYWNKGAPDFNMFDGPSSTATANQDGKNFFAALANLGPQEAREPGMPTVPKCEDSLGVPPAHVESVDSISSYHEGNFPAAQCPKSPAPNPTFSLLV